MIRLAHAGVTLIELVVALTLIALMAAVVGIAIPQREPSTPTDRIMAELAATRRLAVDSGRSATMTVVIGGIAHEATALPDGSIVGDSLLGGDRLSGAPRDIHSATGVPDAR